MTPCILIGCPVWGDLWIERFLRYCLPSIQEGSNWAAIDDRVIYTDARGMQQLRGTPCELIEISPQIMAQDRFAILRWTQEQLLRRAADTGAGLAAMMPDIVYSCGYFPNLKRLAALHDVIVCQNLWAESGPFLKRIDAHRKHDNSISINAVNLGQLGWDCLHPMWERFLVNGRNFRRDMPISHAIAWRGQHSVHIHSAHLNALWLAPELCRAAVLTSNIDACLADLIPANVKPYVPTLDDNLTLVEFADVGNKPQHVHGGSFGEFAQAMRRVGNLRLFRHCCRVPTFEHPDGMTDAQIARSFRQIFLRLMLVA